MNHLRLVLTHTMPDLRCGCCPSSHSYPVAQEFQINRDNLPFHVCGCVEWREDDSTFNSLCWERENGFTQRWTSQQKQEPTHCFIVLALVLTYSEFNFAWFRSESLVPSFFFQWIMNHVCKKHLLQKGLVCHRTNHYDPDMPLSQSKSSSLTSKCLSHPFPKLLLKFFQTSLVHIASIQVKSDPNISRSGVFHGRQQQRVSVVLGPTSPTRPGRDRLGTSVAAAGAAGEQGHGGANRLTQGPNIDVIDS